MKINAYKLHLELVEAGIPIEGVAATDPPRIDFLPEVTIEQQALAEKILAAHTPEDYIEKRQKAYIEAGITIDALVVALWEHVVEGNSDSLEKLQAIRQGVKQRFPPTAADKT